MKLAKLAAYAAVGYVIWKVIEGAKSAGESVSDAAEANAAKTDCVAAGGTWDPVSKRCVSAGNAP